MQNVLKTRLYLTRRTCPNCGCPTRFGTIEIYKRRSFNVSSTLLFMCLGFVRLFICHGLLHHALFFVVVSRTCMSLTVKRPWILRTYAHGCFRIPYICHEHTWLEVFITCTACEDRNVNLKCRNFNSLCWKQNENNPQRYEHRAPPPHFVSASV